MIREINQDVEFLKLKSELATKNDTQIIADLTDTLVANQQRCVGMAANMIGVNKSIIIVQMGIVPVIMVNPKIVTKFATYQTQEGCLSLKGERDTTRYQKITVEYQTKDFIVQKNQFEGFIAQIIQHEIDHLQGIII